MALLDEPHDLIRDGLLAPADRVGELVHGPSAGGVLDAGEDVGAEGGHVVTGALRRSAGSRRQCRIQSIGCLSESCTV